MSEYINKYIATSIPVLPKEHRKQFTSYNDAFETGWNEALSCVNIVPTADVVEVIRCKDCKHKVVTESGEYNPEDIVCDYWQSDGLTENDFCSQGKE